MLDDRRGLLCSSLCFVCLSVHRFALITLSNLVGRYFMGYRRIPPNLVKFECKLKSRDSFSYFQFGIYRETDSLHHKHTKSIFCFPMISLLNDVTMQLSL